MYANHQLHRGNAHLSYCIYLLRLLFAQVITNQVSSCSHQLASIFSKKLLSTLADAEKINESTNVVCLKCLSTRN